MGGLLCQFTFAQVNLQMLLGLYCLPTSAAAVCALEHGLALWDFGAPANELAATGRSGIWAFSIFGGCHSSRPWGICFFGGAKGSRPRVKLLALGGGAGVSLDNWPWALPSAVSS